MLVLYLCDNRLGSAYSGVPKQIGVGMLQKKSPTGLRNYRRAMIVLAGFSDRPKCCLLLSGKWEC